MSGSVRSALSLVPDEPDQILRLNWFRAEHPGIAIHAGPGYWQALLPERAGEIVVTRYLLQELQGQTRCSRQPARRPVAGKPGPGKGAS